MIPGVNETFAICHLYHLFGRDFHYKPIQHFRFTCTQFWSWKCGSMHEAL